MARIWARRLFWGMAAAGIGGCQTPLPMIDATVAQIAAPLDANFSALPASSQLVNTPQTDSTPVPSSPLKLGSRFDERLKVPRELPGAEVEPLPIQGTPEERAAAIQKLYEKPLPPLAADTPRLPGPMTLADLQARAAANSPTLRQAAADVEAARGNLIQAGLLPNPNVGYEADNVASGRTPGFQGGYIEQTIKTGGKIRLNQSSAAVDLANAQVAMRRAQVDLTAKVRAGYFAVLVAEEGVAASKALASLTEQAYLLQVERVKAKLDAGYEPMQLRVLALQSRAGLIQAQNRYLSAWKQLAAALGEPGMPPTRLAGRPDMPVPVFQYDAALACVLSRHTELATAENGILKAQYQLRLAEVTPVPDVLARGVLQRDYTAPPFRSAYNVQVGIPLAIFDRNQGNILQAHAQLGRAIAEVPRVRNDLSQRLAEAFERYNNNRALLDYYRNGILPDQVRAYRGILARYQLDPDKIGVNDIVTAQQTLATAVQSYETALAQAWQAAVDVANLIQADDLFGADCGTAETLPPPSQGIAQ